jgi:transposase
MRKSFDGLHGLVRDRLMQDPLSGHLFLFSNRDRTRLKALLWDGRSTSAAVAISTPQIESKRLESEHENAKTNLTNS